jgi:hypothetical protein
VGGWVRVRVEGMLGECRGITGLIQSPHGL